MFDGFNKLPRKRRKYLRRLANRAANRLKRSQQLGKLEDILNFRDLFYYGLKSCNLVRWKGSVQNFEMHLGSKTARTRRRVLTMTYCPDRYIHFVIRERGKVRPIDAPRVVDRQLQKLLTKEVLLPIYLPGMIYNNGASLKGKGFDFSIRQLKKDLRKHYRKYGTEGFIILIDFSKFFPNADHNIVFERHKQLILDEAVRAICDLIVAKSPNEVGLPLGIETSQAEMIAYPSKLDNYIKCQLGIKGMGHYMDDYYMIIPPGIDPKEILRIVYEKAQELSIKINLNKTKIVPLHKEFVWCKTHYFFGKNGRVITRGNRDNLRRDRHKLKAFVHKVNNRTMSYEELWTSFNGMTSYFRKYNDHNRIIKLNQLFFALFDFCPKNIEVFRAKELLWSTSHLSDTGEKPLAA